MVHGAAPAADETTAAWQLMANHLVRDAYVRLDQIKGAPTREQAFAQAVVAVDYQPVTQDRLREAEATFESLARGVETRQGRRGRLRPARTWCALSVGR